MISKLALQKLLFKNLRTLEPVQKDIPVDAKVTQTTDAKGRVSVDVQTTDGDVYMPKQWATAIAKSLAESLYDKLVGSNIGACGYISSSAFTALPTTGVWERLAGTFAKGLTEEKFAVSSDGRITYFGSVPRWFDVKADLSCDSGVADDYHFAIFRNGIKVGSSEQRRSIGGAADVVGVSLSDRVELSKNDYLEIHAAPASTNVGGGVTAEHAVILIR